MTERPLHLVIVSYPSVLERHFEAHTLLMAQAVGPDFVVERCQEASFLVPQVRTWRGRGRALVRLDLVGHGDGGRFKLGDGLLFTSDGVGYEVAAALGPLLTPDAELRLLGCNVANERHPRDPVRTSGAKLLSDLANQLGARRRVGAPSDYFGSEHWGPRGLNALGEAVLVWSSPQEQSHARKGRASHGKEIGWEWQGTAGRPPQGVQARAQRTGEPNPRRSHRRPQGPVGP